MSGDMGRVLSAVAVVLLLGATAVPAAAQRVTGRITLADAVRIARENNPTFLRTANDLELADLAVRQAWAGFLPSISTDLGINANYSSRVTGTDAFGHPLEDSRRVSRTLGGMHSIGANMTLFDGGRTMRGVRVQRANYAGVEAAIEAQANQLVAQVSNVYFQALRAERSIELEERLLVSAKDRLARTEALVPLAARSHEEVLGARADVAQQEAALQNARGEAEKARLTLATTLGLEPGTSLTLDTTLPGVFDPADLDADVLVASALRSSPSVRRSEVSVEVARQQAASARMNRIPTTITASTATGRNASMLDRFFDTPQNYGAGLSLSVSLPIFNRFQTSGAVMQAAAAEHDARLDLRQARLNLEREVRSAVIDLSNAHRSLQLAEQAAELSRQRQVYAQERYLLGSIDFTSLQNVIDRTAQLERQALSALFAFLSARISLEEKLGHPLET